MHSKPAAVHMQTFHNWNIAFYGVVSVVVVVLLFYVHGKHLRSCRDGQLA